MSKSVRIEEEIYILLAGDAEENRRTVQGQVNVILADYYAKNGVTRHGVHLDPPVYLPNGSKVVDIPKKNTSEAQAPKNDVFAAMGLGQEPSAPTTYRQEYPPVPITDKNKDMDFCKHGSVKGLCKKGCK